MIDVSDLTRTFGDVVAVDNISFSVDRGEIIGLLGPNGAGKTTTLRVITGFLSADSGTVKIGDFSIQENPNAVKKIIGYLPENNPLYLDLRVKDYLKFIARIREIPALEIDEHIQRVVDTVAIKDIFYDNIGTLSKGYKQRVGLAQTLIHDPMVLILDEQTSGLDPKKIIEIRELIKEIGSCMRN